LALEQSKSLQMKWSHQHSRRDCFGDVRLAGQDAKPQESSSKHGNFPIHALWVMNSEGRSSKGCCLSPYVALEDLAPACAMISAARVAVRLADACPRQRSGLGIGPGSVVGNVETIEKRKDAQLFAASSTLFCPAN
jgi:hypothetical protein